jgi:hypothetical protein
MRVVVYEGTGSQEYCHYIKISKRRSIRIDKEESKMGKFYDHRTDKHRWSMELFSLIFLVRRFSTLFCIFSAWPFSSKEIKELKASREQRRHGHGVKLLKLLVLVLVWRNAPCVMPFTRAILDSPMYSVLWTPFFVHVIAYVNRTLP